MTGEQFRRTRERVVIAPDAPVDFGESEGESELAWLCLAARLEHGDGQLWPPQAIVEGAEEEDGGEIARSLLDGRLELDDRLFVVPLGHGDASEAEPSGHASRVCLENPFEAGYRLALLAVGRVQAPEERVESRVPPAVSDRPFHELDGVFPAILLDERGRLRAGGAQGVGVGLDGRVEVLERRRHVLGENVKVAGRQIGGHEGGIDLGRLREHLFGSLEVGPLGANLPQENVGLWHAGREALRHLCGCRGLVETAEKHEGARALEMVHRCLVGLPGDGVELPQRLARASLVRVQGGEPEPDEWIVGELPVELLELFRRRLVSGESERGAVEIAGLRILGKAADHGTEQVHGVHGPVRLEIVLPEGERACQGPRVRMDLFELLDGLRQIPLLGHGRREADRRPRIIGMRRLRLFVELPGLVELFPLPADGGQTQERLQLIGLNGQHRSIRSFGSVEISPAQENVGPNPVYFGIAAGGYGLKKRDRFLCLSPPQQ